MCIRDSNYNLQPRGSASLYQNQNDNEYIEWQGHLTYDRSFVNHTAVSYTHLDVYKRQGLDYPSIGEYETSLLAFASTGAKVMITEWDMSALPTVNRGANIDVYKRQAW